MRRSVWRIGISFLALLAYGALAVTTAWQSGPHYEIKVVALQVILVLPALWLIVTAQSNGNPGTTSRLSRKGLLVAIAGFFLATAVVSWWVSQGAMVNDEGSYRFQALAISQGTFFAPNPPGAVHFPARPPHPLAFSHAIYGPKGWTYHFPVGWPLLLALPERFGFGWLVSPILGALLLLLIVQIAREAFDDRIAGLSLGIAVLSPYTFVSVIGRLSHALCAVLIAVACLQLLRGVRTGQLRHFIWLFFALVAAIQVRILTGAVAAAFFGLAALALTWKRRELFRRVLTIAVLSGGIAITLVLIHNFVVTGDPLVSPYALTVGRGSTSNLFANLSGILANLRGGYRGTAQATVVYGFPLIFLLAAYGFVRVWRTRRSTALLLSGVFLLLILAYVAEKEPFSSIAGERYWFEGYFGVVVLGAVAVDALLRGASLRGIRVIVAALIVGQAGMTAVAARRGIRMSSPERKIIATSMAYESCACTIFLKSTEPDFPQHFIFDSPTWQTHKLFYAIDPGPDLREQWATTLGRPSWVLVSYDSPSDRASVEDFRLVNHSR